MTTSTSKTSFPAGVKPFSERVYPRKICMFDVDMTLSPARRSASPEMVATLKKLRETTATAFVSGSNMVKIEEQLASDLGSRKSPLARRRLASRSR